MTADELKRNSLESRMTVIHGGGGVGKSSLALSASKTNKVLYIDLERVFLQLIDNDVVKNNIDEKNITAWTPSSLKEVIELVKSTKINEFDLTILDSISFLSENEFIDERKNFRDNRKLYGNLIDDFTELSRVIQLRALQFVMITHSTQDPDETGSVVWMPSSKTKKLTANMINRASNILFLETKRTYDADKNPTNNMRLVCCRFSDYAKCKKRDSKIPDEIVKENIVWQDIEKYFTKYEKPKEKTASAQEVLTLTNLLKEGQKLKEFPVEAVFESVKIKYTKDFKKLTESQIKAVIDKMTERNLIVTAENKATQVEAIEKAKDVAVSKKKNNNKVTH